MTHLMIAGSIYLLLLALIIVFMRGSGGDGDDG